jgi:hypothetical protein
MLGTAQIGRCGQYRLLLRGIDSAPMSTDVGVDLVAYSPRRVEPLSIQVKANLRSKPGGGKGQDGARLVRKRVLCTESAPWTTKLPVISYRCCIKAGRTSLCGRELPRLGVGRRA